jgi:hypothetical protein
MEPEVKVFAILWLGSHGILFLTWIVIKMQEGKNDNSATT